MTLYRLLYRLKYKAIMFVSRCARTATLRSQRSSDSISTTQAKILKLHESHKQLKRSPLNDRVDQVKILKDQLMKRKPSLSEAMSFDMGKSAVESQKEIEKAVAHCDYYIKNAEAFLKPQTMKSGQRKIKASLEASGVLFKITPFNFPVWVGFKMLIPNLILGNTVLIRPAMTCLSVGEAIENLIKESSLEAFDIGYTAIEDTEAIVSNKHISGVSFTGSTASGKTIGAIAGKYLKRCVLELGGSDAFIVDYYSATERVIADAITARLSNMGQVCSAAKRFFIKSDIIDDFVNLLTEKIDNYPVMPLYAEAAYEKLVDQIQRGIVGGAEVIKGDLSKLKNKQTDIFVIRVEDKNSPLLTEEVFGPVFVLKKYDTDAEVLDMVNSCRYGLGCSIYNLNLDYAEKMANQVEAGMVFVNSHTVSKSELPWGGVKDSGYGRDCWKAGIETFANLKTIMHSGN